MYIDQNPRKIFQNVTNRDMPGAIAEHSCERVWKFEHSANAYKTKPIFNEAPFLPSLEGQA